MRNQKIHEKDPLRNPGERHKSITTKQTGVYLHDFTDKNVALQYQSPIAIRPAAVGSTAEPGREFSFTKRLLKLSVRERARGRFTNPSLVKMFALLHVSREFYSVKLICRNLYALFSHVRKADTANQNGVQPFSHVKV